MQSRNYGTDMGGQISLLGSFCINTIINIQATIVVYVFEAEFAAAMPNNLEVV